jgi:hypothetical protein
MKEAMLTPEYKKSSRITRKEGALKGKVHIEMNHTTRKWYSSRQNVLCRVVDKL